ncbi:MAG: response regulator [Acidobacteriia bacterium]|nr:response regulator [Terriglobia bacterium]
MPKILVADDNANIQKMVALSLEERGVQVVSVGNGEAAVRRLPDVNPDLVLADIFMPVRNGYEVCEFVKKDERFSHIPVILLVGAFDPLDEKEARRVGADGVLKKPFVPPDPLIAMVMSALEKNPKVAAELAKAREAKEVLPPEPVPQMEIPARAEPKPLPEFPEPSAEEAALVYGFGKGKRTLDDDQTGTAGEPKAPVIEAEDAEDHDFDGTSTTSDWRRNAMDFEVPAEAANRPAFSSLDDLDAKTFPSERDYPPRRVPIPEPAEVADPVVQDRALASAKVETAPPAFIETPAASLPPVEKQAEPEIIAAPVIEPEVKSEPSFSSNANAPHWMDALAPTQAGHTDDAVNATSWRPLEAMPGDESAIVSAPTLEAAEIVEAPTEAIVIAASEASKAPLAPLAHEEPSVADEPAASAPDESWFAPAPAVFEPVLETWHEPVAIASSSADQGLELDPADTAPPLAFKDPDLFEPPAVHVTPEPLLLEDDHAVNEPSQYNARLQEVPPLHSFFAPASGDPVVQEPVAEQPIAADPVAQEETPAQSLGSSSSDWNERIPTAPPPNREALAEIPFLSPPADFHADARDAEAVNSETVDNVVRKVLEKLEPQLHDLLSQGVLKPLVENLLQSELAKKEK